VCWSVLKVELLLGFMIYGELNKWYYCVWRGFDDTAAICLISPLRPGYSEQF